MSTTKMIIGLSRKQLNSLNLLKEQLNINNISFYYSINKHRISVEIYEDNPSLPNIFANNLLIINKFNEIFSVLSACKLQNLSFYAYIGAVMSLNAESEISTLTERLIDMENLNLDGFYDFSMVDLQESWQSLARLSYKLYAECKTDDDVYDLIAFILGVDGLNEASLLLDNGEDMRLYREEKKLSLFPLFPDVEKNIITTLLYYHPKNIIVQYPHKLSPEILKTIQALGD